jgi:mRNA interferase HigB
MRLVGRKHLDAFAAQHAEIRGPLNAWIAEVEEATWKGPGDIKARYPSASFLSDNKVIFNIKGNKYRIQTKLSYEIQVLIALEIGTHAEYSKWK